MTNIANTKRNVWFDQSKIQVADMMNVWIMFLPALSPWYFDSSWTKIAMKNGHVSNIHPRIYFPRSNKPVCHGRTSGSGDVGSSCRCRWCPRVNRAGLREDVQQAAFSGPTWRNHDLFLRKWEFDGICLNCWSAGTQECIVLEVAYWHPFSEGNIHVSWLGDHSDAQKVDAKLKQGGAHGPCWNAGGRPTQMSTAFARNERLHECTASCDEFDSDQNIFIWNFWKESLLHNYISAGCFDQRKVPFHSLLKSATSANVFWAICGEDTKSSEWAQRCAISED